MPTEPDARRLSDERLQSIRTMARDHHGLFNGGLIKELLGHIDALTAALTAAEAERDRLTWTTVLPREPGWYVWIKAAGTVPLIDRISESDIGFISAEHGGWWIGPLPLPAEPAP